MNKKLLAAAVGACFIALLLGVFLGRQSGKSAGAALKVDVAAPSSVERYSAQEMVRTIFATLEPEDRVVLSDTSYAVPDESWVTALLAGWPAFQLSLQDRGWREGSWDCDDYSLAFHLYCRLVTRSAGLPGTLSEGQLYRRALPGAEQGHAKNLIVVLRDHVPVILCIEPQTSEVFSPRSEDKRLTTHILF